MTLEKASFAINMENFNIEQVIGFDALYESMLKCRKGVMWKDSTAGYVLNGIVRTMNLLILSSGFLLKNKAFSQIDISA